MHSLAEDVPRAITNVLSTHNWRGRKQLIDQVFVDDVHFWHLFHDCKNRRELFGVYQMWGEENGLFDWVSLVSARLLHAPFFAGAYNFHIGVKYQRVIPDRKRQQVVVDLEETIVSTISWHDVI